MRWPAIIGAAALLAASIAQAEDRRFTKDAEAAQWAGVGILSRADGAACTAALIRPDVVLTAAHCVADAARQTVVAPADVWFSAGVRDGRYQDRAAAKRIDIHPGYFAAGRTYGPKQVRVDIARVTLDRALTGLPAYAVDGTAPVGTEVALLSYSRGRMQRLSIQSPCRVIDRETEFLRLDCASDPGASGAPYFRIGRDGTTRIVGINSGTSRRGAARTALALAFDHVRDFIGRSGGASPSIPRAGDAPEKSARTTRLPGGSVPRDRRTRTGE